MMFAQKWKGSDKLAYICFFLLHISDSVPMTDVAILFLIATVLMDLLHKHFELAYETVDKTLNPTETMVLSLIMLTLQILFLSFLWEFAETQLYGRANICIGDLCLVIKAASNITVFIIQGLFFKRIKVSSKNN